MSQHLPHPPFVFDLLRFEPGLLEARGIIGGRTICVHRVRTPGVPARMNLRFDLQGVRTSAEEPDLVFVHAEVRDVMNALCVDESGTIEFAVEYGELIGASEVEIEAGIASALIRVPVGATQVRVTARHTSENWKVSEPLVRSTLNVAAEALLTDFDRSYVPQKVR